MSRWLSGLVGSSGFTVDREVGGRSRSFRATFAGAANSLCLALLDTNRMHSQTSGARADITSSRPLGWEPDLPVRRTALTSPDG